jgi:hypothetical protein
MSNLIAKCVDNGVMILAAFLLFRSYLNPRVKSLYQKKWVPFGCVFLLLYGSIEIGLAYRDYSKTRIPSKAELIKSIRADHTLAEADLVFRSPAGYSILVPKGYAYTSFASGPFSLTEIKDQSAIVVGQQPCSDSLDSTVQDVCSYLKRKNPTYSFSTPVSVQIGTTPAIRLEAQVTKENGLVKCYILFFKKDGQLFQLLCSSPAAMFQDNTNQFETVIASLALD